jgi:guanine deaminase
MTDQDYLKQAVALSQNSPEPIGCGVVIVSDGRVVGQAFNSQRADNVAVYHAEIKAIIAANRKLGSRKIPNSIAYCSCEPCVMCLSALLYAKISRIVFSRTMADLFPDDPQAKTDSYDFVKSLNFVPRLEQLKLT